MIILVLLFTVGVALSVDYLKTRKELKANSTEKFVVSKRSTLAV